jgi:F-type H+-transporting ATPase subunit b
MTMTQWTMLLAVEAAEKGKLFDFDATLPLMAIQFVVLVFVLNALFYKPLGKVLDDRAEYIRGGVSGGKEKLAEAEKLTKQYEEELAQARREAQSTIAAAKAEATDITSKQIAEAQAAAQAQREQAQQEIDRQKQDAFAALQQEVDALSRQILTKLLGSELVK